MTPSAASGGCRPWPPSKTCRSFFYLWGVPPPEKILSTPLLTSGACPPILVQSLVRAFWWWASPPRTKILDTHATNLNNPWWLSISFPENRICEEEIGYEYCATNRMVEILKTFRQHGFARKHDRNVSHLVGGSDHVGMLLSCQNYGSGSELVSMVQYLAFLAGAPAGRRGELPPTQNRKNCCRKMVLFSRAV